MDDWCGSCGNQTVELAFCKECGDMFCEECLSHGFLCPDCEEQMWDIDDEDPFAFEDSPIEEAGNG